MSKRDISVLFIGKTEDQHTQEALDYCRLNFTDVTSYLGAWGDPLPEEMRSWNGDYVISYFSRWILPEWLLKKPRIAAINFHPASPEYPGFGCANFALYEQTKEYGVTCHHMAPLVDTGSIIAVKRFRVFDADNVASLLSRAYDYQLILFYDMMAFLLEGKELPVSDARWTRRPFTRKDFNKLGRITPDMSQEEVARRVRATDFGIWKPAVELHGFVFELKNGS